MRKQLIKMFLIFFLLIFGTVLVVMYGKGYRIGKFDNGKPTISKTGMLVATSIPNGAQIFIDTNLTSATDDTINLLPGEYTIKIVKDGFFPWEKRVSVKRELVTKAEALLLPNAPRLESITTSGISEPVIDPSGRKLAFRIASQSAKKNGIYVLDMSANPILTLQNSARQIADDTTAPFSTATYAWSPDGEEIIATVSAEGSSYRLKTSGLNDIPSNVTAILPSVQEEWHALVLEKEQARMLTLNKELRKLITDNFAVMAWSPDETKILYTASSSAQLPLIITPRRIGIDTMREERNITKGDVYVYDLKDDLNYKIVHVDGDVCRKIETTEPCRETTPVTQWLPDSKHLITVENKKINIMEIDGTNKTTIFAGPFLDSYVFPWPNGSKIVILTNFNNPDVLPNLYTIGLK